MKRARDPREIDDSVLREFAAEAAWIVTIHESMLRMLLEASLASESEDDEEGETADIAALSQMTLDDAPWELDHYSIAGLVMFQVHEMATNSLKERIEEWFDQDQSHARLYRKTLLDPWRNKLETRLDVPGWVMCLARASHDTFHPGGHRPGIDFEAPN